MCAAHVIAREVSLNALICSLWCYKGRIAMKMRMKEDMGVVGSHKVVVFGQKVVARIIIFGQKSA